MAQGWKRCTEVQAYRADGGRLGVRHWNHAHDRIVWQTKRGRVTFDGVKVHNCTTSTVLFACWHKG